MGIAAVTVGVPRDRLMTPLRHPAARPVLITLAIGELVFDKIPGVPKRTEPPGLIARVSLGVSACAGLAWSRRRPTVVPAIIGGSVALATAFVGATVREHFSDRLPTVMVALAEDLLAAFLAAAALAGDRYLTADRSMHR